MFGAAQVGDTNPRRIGLPAGATDRDQPDASPPAMGDQRGLDAEAVDAVNDIVVVRVQQVREILEGEEVLDDRDATIGVDLPMRAAMTCTLAMPSVPVRACNWRLMLDSAT